MEWRPIETAPKDGTWFLAYGDRINESSAPKIGCARWLSRSYQVWEYVTDRSQELVDKDDSGWDYNDGDIAFPTHWMPLPQPPEAI